MPSLNMFAGIKNNFPAVLEKHKGLIASACAEAGVSRTTYYNWRKADPDFARLCDDVEERMGDYVEGSLLKLIDKEDTAATIFYCKTKLRNRGYSEKIEIDNPNRQVIDVTISLKDEDRILLERYRDKHMKQVTDGSHTSSDT